ncbi:cytochrome P450 [Gigaspora rosea]|uniref:Cytochrome P450 n=1 Tax=Gigaspora rosea TaxID=44941 RepID=A0A397TWX1_9GLOM|nr:cytochrome P450 [Gigaspora rosea]
MFINKIIESISLIEFFILIFITYISIFYYRYFTRPNPLPGPLPLPFIGNFLNLGSDVNQFYEQCQKKYGDISEVILNDRYIILSRPEYIRKLCAPAEFAIQQPYLQGTEEIGIYGNGIFLNGDEKSWKFNRQFFNEALSLKVIESSIKSINQLYDEINGYWQSLGNQISSNNENWTIETDFSKWFHGFTNEVTSILITGKRTYSIASYYNTQSIIKSNHSGAIVENGIKFTDTLVKYLESILFFSLFGPFFRHYVPIIKSKSKFYLKNRDYLFENLDNIIKSRREEIKRMRGTEIKTNMLSALITAETAVEGENFRPMTDKEIRGNLIDAFIGGSDTAASLFCYITYYLCKNPHVKQKMVEEIDSVLPNSSDRISNSLELKKLKYCKAIILEAGRLMPPIAIMSRHITKECEIAGYMWPAGFIIIMMIGMS